ncbi:hypothetical protein CVT25_003619 [Psilocybe cyanescens]|uniref:Nudix hydrolase domain-containing protein n=1 Tax=Psilocybe cyanescens TaxID=93625 RepID=A0A409WPA6_PSICY|nr:hypothetical protein CVT25_003619 [Psilocybe cyanescens]
MSSDTGHVSDNPELESGATTPSETPTDAGTGASDEVELGLPLPIPNLSEWSTSAIAPSAWCSTDFMVGVGMVIIQQKTQKIVVLYSTKWKYWFFPRGRKDVGESIEQAALREAHEESGYRVQFLPLINPTRQPHSPSMRNRQSSLNTEPIFMTTTNWQPGRNGPHDHGGVYLTSWFVGQMLEDAKCETGTRMPDEQHFETHLLSYDEVMKRIWGSEINVLQYVWAIYQHTLEVLKAGS